MTEHSTLSFHVAAGYEEALGPDGFIPVWDRFYVGGIYSNRGYNFGYAGPMPFGYLVGGNKELIFNADYVWPIFAKFGFYGDIFFDDSGEYLPGQPLSLSGFSWPGTGIGIMWNSPMGPLTLDLGWPLANNAYIQGFPETTPVRWSTSRWVPFTVAEARGPSEKSGSPIFGFLKKEDSFL